MLNKAQLLLNISMPRYRLNSLPQQRKNAFSTIAETSDMVLSSPFSAEDAKRHSRIIQEGIAVRRHYDFLIWLQGEIQHYLPHEIMLSAWGNFNANLISYDIVSALLGVRTDDTNMESVSPLLQGLFNRWIELDKVPYALSAGESGFLLEDAERMRTDAMAGGAAERARAREPETQPVRLDAAREDRIAAPELRRIEWRQVEMRDETHLAGIRRRRRTAGHGQDS